MNNDRSEDEQEIVADAGLDYRSLWPGVERIGECIEAGVQWRRHKLVKLRNSLLRLASGMPLSRPGCGGNGADWLRSERSQMETAEAEPVASCPFPRRIHRAHVVRTPLPR